MRHAAPAALVAIVAASAVTLSARGPQAHGSREKSHARAAECQTNDEGTASDVHVTPALTAARTVFVVDPPTPPTAARSMSELQHELGRWSRWDQVERRNAADVTLSIAEIQGEGNGAMLTVTIRARETGTVLWVSSGRNVAAALKSLEVQLPSPRGACAGLSST